MAACGCLVYSIFIISFIALLSLTGQSIATSELQFEDHPAVIESRVGQNVVLNCKVEGSPIPVIHWEHNGRPIFQEVEPDTELHVSEENERFIKRGLRAVRKLQLGATKSRLYLDCITPERAGEYTCVATTPIRTIRTDTTLRVDASESHSCVAKRRDHVKPARINMWTVSRLEYQGATVQLFCRTEGHPKPLVQWLDGNDEAIQNGNKYQKLANGDLIIKEVNFAGDMGFYKCQATNEAGMDEVSIFLYPTAI